MISLFRLQTGERIEAVGLQSKIKAGTEKEPCSPSCVASMRRCSSFSLARQPSCWMEALLNSRTTSSPMDPLINTSALASVPDGWIPNHLALRRLLRSVASLDTHPFPEYTRVLNIYCTTREPWDRSRTGTPDFRPNRFVVTSSSLLPLSLRARNLSFPFFVAITPRTIVTLFAKPPGHQKVLSVSPVQGEFLCERHRHREQRSMGEQTQRRRKHFWVAASLLAYFVFTIDDVGNSGWQSTLRTETLHLHFSYKLFFGQKATNLKRTRILVPCLG